MIYYQGLALLELGRDEEAQARFRSLLEYGRTHIDEEVEIDYFAVSLPDFLIFEPDIQAKHRIHCKLMSAFGLIGLGRIPEARRLLSEILANEPANVWAASLMRQAESHDPALVEARPIERRATARSVNRAATRAASS